MDAPAHAMLGTLAGRVVARFDVWVGDGAGAIGPSESRAVEQAAATARSWGVPLVGELTLSGPDVHAGLASLHGWGRAARAVTRVSGVVPVIVVVGGPCVGGPALLLGLADHVVMTADAFAYVSGPAEVARMTGVAVDAAALGGSSVHARTSGLPSMVVPDLEEAWAAVADLLSYLPPNSLVDPTRVPVRADDTDAPDDPVDRPSIRAARAVPERAAAAYDVREVVEDVVDHGSFLELHASWAPNVVVGYARVAGRPVGIVANQPWTRAGTLDVTASAKAARFVLACDALNVPLVTFVDTPGFEPGKDLEWRGMIRHGAKLVQAYATATVPRVCVVLRKAYGGAYIVMDSKGLGNDLCFAWPGAEIAVMGAAGAVAVLEGRRLARIDREDERDAERARLEGEYAEHFLNPWRAAERGLVDAVIPPEQTRAAVAASLEILSTKRETGPARRHSNIPL
jgi:acetyl-CoA carboxylase carboxyltransferase component